MRRKRRFRWMAGLFAVWMLLQASAYWNPRQDGYARAQGEEAFTYSVRGTDATITGYTGEDRDVVVPEQIDGMTVVAIGGRAFYGDAIRSITLPDTVQSIGKRAFAGCTSLISVQLPAQLQTIDDEAFQGCTQLQTLSLPGQLREIGSSAFENCAQLQQLALPASLETLEEGAFAYCDALSVTLDASNPAFVVEQGALYDADRKTLYRYDGSRPDASFAVPEGVEAIDLHAFTGCPSLTSISLPKSIRTMDDAFYKCHALQRVEVAPENATFDSQQGVLYQRNPMVLWYYPSGKADAQFALPEGCALIQPALRSAQKLQVLRIPQTLVEQPQSLGQNWVSLKKALEQSDLPALTAFEVDAANARYHSAQGALYETESGTLLQVPRQLVAETFAIAQGTQAIAANAFKGCTGIGTLQLPEGMQAFAAGYLAQTNVTGIHLPSTLTSFDLSGNQPASLRQVTVAQSNPAYMARDGLLYVLDTEGWTLCLIPASRSGVRLTIPQDVYAMALCPEAPFASLRQLEIPQQVQGVSIDASDEVLAALTSQLTIYGWPDSAAHRFALQNGIAFVSMAPTPTPTPTVKPTPTATPAPGEIADVPALVHQLYSSFFKRDADAEGFVFWTQALSQGRWTAAQVVGAFATSDEYRGLRTDDQTYLTDVYKACMGREPDAEGLAFWLARLRMGYSRNLVLEQMLHCDEFVDICRDCKVELGHIALTRPAEQYSWLCPLVAQQCEAFIGELVDEQTFDYLVQGLQRREISGGVLTMAMAELGTMLNGESSDAQFVAQLYKACMGRAGDAEGLVFWTQMLQRGQTRETVMMHFFVSEEFTTLCRSLGIDPL